MPDSLSGEEVLDLMNKAKDRLHRAEKIAPPRVAKLKEFYDSIKPMLENVNPEKKKETLRKMMEIAFFKIGKKPQPEQPPEQEKEEEPNLGYEHYFKPKEEPAELPKVYTGWEHYEKEKDKDKEVEEARILHPESKVDVYYLAGKMMDSPQVVYKNIPYELVDKEIGRAHV